MDTPRPPSDIFDYLQYDPASGDFTWIRSSGGSSAFGRRAGSFDVQGYRRINFRNVRYRASRLAWLFVTGDWPDEIVDHINLLKGDNRFSNLRLATKALNSANTSKRFGCSSSFKGVTRVKGGRWQAQIGLNGRTRYLGLFATQEAAAAAYRSAAMQAFGDYARAK